jgi:hypothetical protein
MKVYEINSGWQRHLVVANSIAEAEKTFNDEYGDERATKIEKICDYVQISDSVAQEIIVERTK